MKRKKKLSCARVPLIPSSSSSSHPLSVHVPTALRPFSLRLRATTPAFSVLTLFCPATPRRRLRQRRAFSYTRSHSLSLSLSFSLSLRLHFATFLTTDAPVDRKPMRFFDLRKSLIGNRPFCGRYTRRRRRRRRKPPSFSLGMNVISA